LASPTQGQCFFYFGNRPDAFAVRFADIGFIAGAWASHERDRRSREPTRDMHGDEVPEQKEAAE
jgi:hypothetical protein